MVRNNSIIMVGRVFEYSVSSTMEPGQDIENIAKQLTQLGLVLEKKNDNEGNVRRLSDAEGIERYKALLVEWSGDDQYHDTGGEPWHVYVGKVISEEHGTVNLKTIEDALRETEKDFPNPKVLHCTSPRPVYD